MKKIMPWLTVMILLMSMLCVPVGFAETGTEEEPVKYKCGDYTYTLDGNGNACICDYGGKDEKVEIPETLDGNAVVAIGDMAFWGCKALTSITIPDSVTSIGDEAFYSCEALISITIPDSVTSIGDNPFSDCDSLCSISVSPNHPTLTVIDNVLFEKATKKLICYPNGLTSSEYTIPNGIQIIGDKAFSSCKALTNIMIPDSVTSIEDDAFSSCKALTNITIPDSVTSIGDWAFSYCEALTSITIPDSVTSIGDWAFYSCEALTSITIPDSVTSIGDIAFYYCANVTLTVERDSYAATYAEENKLKYTYPDANDWLYN